uniref:Uncharacterized protein n=1 Tax=Leptobrachium leishanense TaxID=445787 RepID=A0A8C5QAP5_9ANUR
MNPSSVCLLRCFLRPPHGGGFTSGLIPGAADNETCSLVEGRSLLRCRLYAVIFPSEIRVLSPQLACLHVEGASGETSVQLTLTSSNGNTSLIDKSFQLDSLFTCIPFQQNEEVCTINVVIKMPQETLFKQTKVLLKKERSSVVVQTDKPIYKPGQTGKHREGVSLNVKFQGMSFNSFSQDPANNRIGQWLNVTLNEGISEFSLPLSAEPTLGDYKVWVKGKVSTFSVQEYVLPKFEIRLHLPKAVMFNQETIPVKVCGKYTYGKPVQGAYRIKVCREYARPYLSHVPGLRALYIVLGWLQTLTNPFCCLHVSFFYSLFGRILQTFHILTFSFILHAGVEMTTQSGAVIAMMLEKVSFVDADKMYRPGIPYSGTVRVTDVSSHNIVLHAITIHSLNVAVSDQNGYASFKLENTTFWGGQATLIVSNKSNAQQRLFIYSTLTYNCIEWTESSHSVTHFYSRSKSFLKLRSLGNVLPCEGQQEVQMDYIINGAKLDMETKKLDFHYLVRLPRKGNLINSMMLPCINPGDLTGSTSFNFPLTPDVSPNLRVLAYILLPDGEIAADSAKFTVQRCFKNKVSVGFTPDEVLPGSDVSLQIQADPGSLCGLRVVDHSVILMKPEKELTADKVRYSSMFLYFKHNQNKKIYPVPDRSKAVLLYPPQAAYARNPEYSICKEGANKGCFPRQPNHNKSFQCAGRYLAQGCVLKTHTCLFVSSDCHFISHCCGFLYRDSGSVVLHETAPDTITDWNAGAFCMGPSGFGLASPASLRVFQPFFVDLTLPYSVVRGESFTLKASVFNYLKEWYQRQLTYKHGDGSYSAFGKSDKEGNTWLTAFVVKSFSKARPYIFIDETHLNQSFNWLKKHRKDDGCFQTIGKLFNTALKVPCLSPPPTLYALSCLRKAAVDVSNVYTQALLAYTFTLAEDTETRQILLEKLEKQAVRKDGQLHWERPSAKPTSDHPFWYRAPSAEVELTSYMLMTSLSGPEKNLGRASEIVNWLSKQQNPYGGFSSTQDTVVALHDAGDVTVTVRSQTGVQEFHVDNTNRLLLQKASLPDIPGDYTNVLILIIVFIRYTGPREKSNMALIEVKMLSGYIPVKISVREVSHSLHGFQFLFNKQLQVISWGSCLCLSVLTAGEKQSNTEERDKQRHGHPVPE